MDREYHLLLEVFLIYIYLEFCNILLVLFCFANRMYVCSCQYETYLDNFHWSFIGLTLFSFQKGLIFYENCPCFRY